MNSTGIAASPLIARPTEKPVRPFFESALLAHVPGLRPLIRRYRELPPTNGPADFARRSLESLDITVRVSGEPLAALPASGPLLLAANHPFGGVEGLVLAALRIRPDIKILANRMLCSVPELRPLIIPVDVFGAKRDAGNVSGLRAALRHLESGGALAVFPAGVVSHWHLKQRRVTDPEWNPLIGRLARTSGAAVVPLHFEGGNSLLFQAAGCLHPFLRTALLPREMWRMRGRGLRLCVGKPVEAGLLAALRDDEARAAHLRARCYALGRAADPAERNWPVPVAAPEKRPALLDEIADLPSSRILAEDEKFRVFHVAGGESPRILREIGRLREESFRAALEGSGKALDLDRFDPHYSHLVLWDKQSCAVAGGYRARCFFPSESSRGGKTLYTTSLFRFEPEFFERCGVSMEMGRAFVALRYQRDYSPLMMLWKGIGRLASLSGVRTLFGPSSIGLGYAPESVAMLRQHLEEKHYDAGLAALVQGRRQPAPFAGLNAPDARGLDYKTVDRAVKELEGDKGLPILFKHYLQLGGRIAAFHEDRAFGTLDALMVVDLAAAPEKLLLRYMGQDGLRMLRKAHAAAGR